MTSQSAVASTRPIKRSLQEYGRGIAGGLLFSMPLLYTMEVWWAGFTMEAWRLLIGTIAVFLLLLAYNRYAGVHYDASFSEVVIDSIEELGIGIVLSALILVLLGQIDTDMPAYEIMGKIIVEGLTVAIGVSVGTAQLGASDDGDEEGAEQHTTPLGRNKDAPDTQRFGGQLIVSLCGAVLFAANVAPTEEIIMIAFESTPWRILGLAAFSIVMSALILYYSGFRGAKSVAAESWSSVPVGLVITYAIALIASAGILWFFGRFDGLTLGTAIRATVVLAVAASLGASAGRLLLQSSSQSDDS